MDEVEFQRLLQLFPPVRSASYCADDIIAKSDKDKKSLSDRQWDGASMPEKKNFALGSSDGGSISFGGEDDFWAHLKAAAGQKLPPDAAEQFVHAFRLAHQKLVNGALPLETAKKIMKISEMSLKK